eukprot:Rhum_TRINITY_DN13151_c0_g1::Rhum_TRINITY_DN13151_c0_g1_i1::g.57467::m.57467
MVYREGQDIEVEYGGEWFRATIRSLNHAAGTLDADWGDGTFAMGLRLHEVRAMRRDRSPSPPLAATATISPTLGVAVAPPPAAAAAAAAPLLTRAASPAAAAAAAEAALHSSNVAFAAAGAAQAASDHLLEATSLVPSDPLLVDPAYVSSLYKTLSLKCGLFPPSSVPVRDLLWFFRTQGEEATARTVFCDPLNPLFPAGALPDGGGSSGHVSPRRQGQVDGSASVTLTDFLRFYSRGSPKVQDWVDSVVFGPEYLLKLQKAGAGRRLLPEPPRPVLESPPPPPPASRQIAAPLPPPLSPGHEQPPQPQRYQGEEEVDDVEARVNTTGSPHRTRQLAEDARRQQQLGLAPPEETRRDRVSREVYERVNPPPSPTRAGARRSLSPSAPPSSAAYSSPPPSPPFAPQPARGRSGGGGAPAAAAPYRPAAPAAGGYTASPTRRQGRPAAP